MTIAILWWHYYWVCTVVPHVLHAVHNSLSFLSAKKLKMSSELKKAAVGKKKLQI